MGMVKFGITSYRVFIQPETHIEDGYMSAYARRISNTTPLGATRENREFCLEAI